MASVMVSRSRPASLGSGKARAAAAAACPSSRRQFGGSRFVLLRRRPPPTASPPRAAAEPAENELQLVEPLGVGLRRDLRQRLPFYGSDWADGLNLKTVAACCFMFFSCLAPAVAFGSLLELKTAGAMGALEMLLSTSVCGMVYALFSGQPVTIIGSTGPVLAFTAIMFSTCQQMHLPFLATYAWVGLWTSAILLVCALTSTSNLVIRHLTRFTDEIFAGLISVIFVVEAMKSIVSLLFDASVGAPAALLSVMMAVGTCWGALSLAGLRTKRFLSKRARATLADFGPTVAIVACTAATAWLVAKYDIVLPYLSLPAKIAPSTPRPWLVDIWQTPVWARWGSAIPAVMVSILMFFDQNITTRLVNSKDNNMKKGYGYHVDLLIVALNTLVFSLLGMPWLVAATVRSVNHLRALTSLEDQGGDQPEAALEPTKTVTETRVSGFVIHLAIGASVLYARDLLTSIPQCVLMGLFLYLGLSAVKGNSFLERVSLFWTGKDRMPQLPYVTDISIKATHKFTALQIASLLALVVLKESKFGILFPVVIAALQIILVMAVRAKWFTAEEIAVLDKE